LLTAQGRSGQPPRIKNMFRGGYHAFDVNHSITALGFPFLIPAANRLTPSPQAEGQRGE